ncbi:MAG: hypothetical protein JTT14_02305, partial [Candidatus Brockarchaeota archaeon]|nr:hypothetical protein [Candidatus Brockarchaeota archaeon]
MKCENGHETGLKLFCSVCGKPVSYKNAIDIVLAIPEFKIKYEKAALVSLDFKINSLEEMYAATLEVGDDSTITENRFVAKLILGGSWYDYIKAYEDEVRRWMNII